MLEAPKQDRSTNSGRLTWPVLAALALLLSACGGTTELGLGGPPSSATEQSLASAADPSELRLEAGDKIHVTVYGEENLTGDYKVSTGDYVALPYIGSVKASGLTPPELESALEARFRKKLFAVRKSRSR